ncbi:MAG: hypothetical protein RLZZ450_5958 [Pseudomonadota bacterium]
MLHTHPFDSASSPSPTPPAAQCRVLPFSHVRLSSSMRAPASRQPPGLRARSPIDEHVQFVAIQVPKVPSVEAADATRAWRPAPPSITATEHVFGPARGSGDRPHPITTVIETKPRAAPRTATKRVNRSERQQTKEQLAQAAQPRRTADPHHHARQRTARRVAAHLQSRAEERTSQGLP